jgi:predicted RecB family nuclease
MRLDARTALECHEYLHKSHAPNRFDLSRAIAEDEIVKEYKRQGLQHEEKVKDFLRTLPLKVITITDEQGDQSAQELTARALLDPSIDIILGAHIGEHCEGILATLTNNESLGDKSRVSRPDLLIRTSDSPKWAPVDIKFHSAFDDSNKSNQVIVSRWPAHLPEHGITLSGKLEEEDGLQLAHYHQHLSNLGLASDDYLVAIIGREYEAIAWAHLHQTKKGLGKNASNYLNIYYEDFLTAEQIVTKSRARNQDQSIDPPSIPKLISGKFGCDMCTFKVICREEMESFDNNAGHVTLLAQVTPTIAAKHFPDIESIKELAQAEGLSDTGEKARRRAEVWLTKKPKLVDPSKPLEIPEFDIEVDIDLENSQALLEEILEGERMPDDRVYLYGYGIHDRTKSKDWRSAEIHSIYDFANTDEAEYKVLTQMWQELERIAAQAKTENKTLGIFHYSSHEKTWWRRYAKRFSGQPNVPTLDHVEEFINLYFVDLLEYTRKVAFPLTGYSIKLVAPFAGFHWSVEGAGGASSLLKYKEATTSNTDESARVSAQEWLIAYNRDDVKATYAAREFLRHLKI